MQNETNGYDKMIEKKENFFFFLNKKRKTLQQYFLLGLYRKFSFNADFVSYCLQFDCYIMRIYHFVVVVVFILNTLFDSVSYLVLLTSQRCVLSEMACFVAPNRKFILTIFF